MSTSTDHAALKSSLKAHNESFDQLLRTIPAQYYIRSETDSAPAVPLTKAQKKAAKKQAAEPAFKAAKSEALRKAKLARYDPDQPKTIPEIQKKMLEDAEKGKGRAEDSDEDDEMEGEWEDASDDEEGDDDSANESDFVDSDLENGDELDGTVFALNPTLAKKDVAEGPAPTITELRAKLQKRIADIQAHKRGAAAGEEEKGASSKEELLEERRRQRGLVRDNRRKKRKAERREEKERNGGKEKEKQPSNGRKGGGKANAPVKEPREEWGHDDEDEDRPRKKTKAISESTPSSAVVVSSKAVAAPSAPTPSSSKPVPNDSLSFSTLDFSTSTLLSPSANKKKNRHALPKDANAALAVLAARKEKMDALDPEKKEKMEEKEKWEKINLKAEGEKVRDDEKRLKKMAKRQEKIKSKSAKAWAERKQTVSNTINAKVEKRNSNLAARVKAAKDKKAGIKVKDQRTHKKTSKSFSTRVKGGGRPGFEGGSKRKK